MNIIDKFWSYVEKTEGCWIWIGKVDPSNGCCYFGFKSKKYSATRFSWELEYNLPPRYSLKRVCATSTCVRPNHLIESNYWNHPKQTAKPEQTLEDYFMSKIEQTELGCWRWKGSINKSTKHCILSFQGKQYIATHVAWKIRHGSFPSFPIQRTCQTINCVNFAHLIESDIESRFWRSVEKTDSCWNWIGQLTDKGYGYIRAGNEHLAHRVSWQLHNGKIPEGLNILHHCDHPVCVRPDHLYAGTHQDNMRDMVVRNRAAKRKGEVHHNAKLTEQDVLTIRRLRAEGLRPRHIAAQFGIKSDTVYQIVKRNCWKHI